MEFVGRGADPAAGGVWPGELFDSAALGIAISRLDGRIVQANSALAEILGYAEGELAGRPLSELFVPGELPAVRHGYQLLLSGAEQRFRCQVRMSGKHGETPWGQLTATVLRDTAQKPRYLLTSVHDITESHLLKEQLTYQSLHDLPTGLANRNYLLSHLEKVLGQAGPSAVVTLLSLDLDGFSGINDGLGHPFGDRLLNAVARRLESVVADQRAMVARIGADEYAILVEPGPETPDPAALAETVNAELGKTIHLDELGVAVTASIGIVQRQVGQAGPAELLRAAGATRNRLRGTGKRRWAVFDPSLDTADRAECRLATAVHEALRTGQLQVRYQPVVTLDDGRLVGIEAVLSWPHPRLGPLPQERCARLAEASGMGPAVTEWVLRTAASQAQAWQDQLGGKLPPLALNLACSPVWDPNLTARIGAVLRQTGLRPGALEVRLPVAAVTPGPGAQDHPGSGGPGRETLQALINLGVRTSLHGVGTDLSGLSCLGAPWVKAVRLAETVARQVVEAPCALPAQALGAVVAVLRSAGIRVIVPAVDTERQATWWRAVGADYAVGALFGPPSTAQHAEALLVSHLKTAHKDPSLF